jgi:hypothetical protein
MRKCTVAISTQIDRTDVQLQELWEESVRNDMEMERLFPGGIQPQISYCANSGAKREFFHINRSYCEVKNVFGLFHQWGNDFTEFENGPGNYTVAVVELVDGTMITPQVKDVRFLPPDHDGFRDFAYLGHQNLGRMMF